MEAYRKGIQRPLIRSERKLIVRTVVNELLNKKIRLRRKNWMPAFLKLRNVFKKEVASIYFMPAKKRNSKKTQDNGEKQKDNKSAEPSGILYNNYRYQKSKRMKLLKKYGKLTHLDTRQV